MLIFFSQLLVGDDVDVFLHTITEGDILETTRQGLSDENRFIYIYRQEVMRTAVNGRYSGMTLMVKIIIIVNFIFNMERSSPKHFLRVLCCHSSFLLVFIFKPIHMKFFAGYLQVLLMAGALQRRIIQHCDVSGMDLYNTEIVPIDIPPNVTPIRILWCSFVNGVKNHIVPLRKCIDKNGKLFI